MTTLHAVLDEVLLDEGGHLDVERGEQLVGELDDGDLDAAFDEVLGQFDPDEAAAHDHGGRLRAGEDGIDSGSHLVDVTDVAQGECPLHAGDRGHERRGARREDEVVVVLEVLLSGGEVADP